MCKFNPKNNSRFIDPCMVFFIFHLNKKGIKTLSCCCGHGKYSMTVVVKAKTIYGEEIMDLCSGIIIDRKKRFYKKDKQGYYYIPEVNGPQGDTEYPNKAKANLSRRRVLKSQTADIKWRKK